MRLVFSRAVFYFSVDTVNVALEALKLICWQRVRCHVHQLPGGGCFRHANFIITCTGTYFVLMKGKVQNFSFETGHGGKFTPSTQLLLPNHPNKATVCYLKLTLCMMHDPSQ